VIGRDLLGIEDLERSDIERILETAQHMQEVGTRQVKKVPTLRGRTIVNLFFEPSTRTRTSFEIAGKRLSADVVNFSTSSSSLKKAEGIVDTAKTLDSDRRRAGCSRHQCWRRVARTSHAGAPGSPDRARGEGARGRSGGHDRG
jgi:aspartate carbamoyltransferase catalytic subunit